VSEPASPTPSSPPPADRPGVSPGLVLIVAVLALGVSVATWLLQSREISQLQREIAGLHDEHRALAQQGPGRGAPSAVGQTVDVAGAPALGPADAVVTLIEFSDYECPFCIRHFQQTMPQIRQQYIDTGRVRYVFRDFPIDQNHPQAIRAHEAAHCALEQQRFWDLHVRLFSAPGTHTPLALEDRAREAHLDEAAFRACVASGRTSGSIRQTVQLIESLGATGTPWFLVGLRDPQTDRVRILRTIGGAQPFAQFAQALDAAAKESASEMRQ
jgi:protein-disulfide isomerase